MARAGSAHEGWRVAWRLNTTLSPRQPYWSGVLSDGGSRAAAIHIFFRICFSAVAADAISTSSVT